MVFLHLMKTQQTMIRTRIKRSKTTAAEEPASWLSTGRTTGSLLRRARAISSSDMASSLARSGTAVKVEKVAGSQTFLRFLTVETVPLGQEQVVFSLFVMLETKVSGQAHVAVTGLRKYHARCPIKNSSKFPTHPVSRQR